MNVTAEGEWELPRGTIAAQVARARVSSCCAELPSEVIETAVLLASELVTNAFAHAQGRIRLRVARTGSQLRVAVSDESAGVELHASTPPLLATGGRGLMLVEQLAGSWGVIHSDGSKTVWFCLP